MNSSSLPPKRRLSDFPGPTGRSTSRSSQRLLQDVLQIVVQGHLLADQAFDGKQLDHLVLVPNGKLATLRFHLEEDAPSSHLRTEVGRFRNSFSHVFLQLKGSVMKILYDKNAGCNDP